MNNQGLLTFAKKLLDDDEINKENLDYWADEYLHAYNALANVMEVDDKRRKAEQQRDELREALQKLVDCIETLKANGFQTDWFDCAWINQELKRAKKALGEEG